MKLHPIGGSLEQPDSTPPQPLEVEVGGSSSTGNGDD